MKPASGFAERFALALKLRGKKQEEVAKAVGVTQQAVDRWNRGINGSTKMYQVAKELKVNPDWLIFGDGPMEIKEMDDDFLEIMKRVDNDEIKEALINLAAAMEKLSKP